jgi:hypothetical protein
MEEVLTSQLQQLQAELSKAQQAQQALNIKQAVVSAMCIALQAMQHELDPSEVVADEWEDLTDCSFMLRGHSLNDSQLSAADLALLQQQLRRETQHPCCSSFSSNQGPSSPKTPRQPPADTNSDSSSSASLGSLADAADQPTSGLAHSSISSSMQEDSWPDDTLSPIDDPLQFFRQLFQDGPLPWAASLTLPELHQQYLAAWREGFLHLTLLDNQQQYQQQSGATTADASLAVIKQLVQQHLHRWTSLMVYGRSDLLCQFHLRWVAVRGTVHICRIWCVIQDLVQT